MNYMNHYNKLIARSFGRVLACYSEKHHILPRCMGGNNDAGNIAILTAREHFVAHQLLCKIYPGVKHLIFALRMLSTGNNGRKPSRLHGWLRNRMADTAAANSRERNKADPSILRKAQVISNLPASRAKAVANFKATLAKPEMAEKFSKAAVKRWEDPVIRDKATRAIRNGFANGSRSNVGERNPRACAVAQLLPNGFIVNEFDTIALAAVANGLDRHTVSDRIKRGHPLWKEI